MDFSKIGKDKVNVSSLFAPPSLLQQGNTNDTAQDDDQHPDFVTNASVTEKAAHSANTNAKIILLMV